NRGKILPRSACRNPWQNFVNVRVAWGWPVAKGQRIEAQLDIFNLMNLLNSEWGQFTQVTGFENTTAFLRPVGFDMANNRPVYTYAPIANPVTTILTPTQSRWRIQLGARYVF